MPLTKRDIVAWIVSIIAGEVDAYNSSNEKPARIVTFDGRTIADTSALLKDPSVRATLEKLSLKVKRGHGNFKTMRGHKTRGLLAKMHKVTPNDLYT